MTQNRVYRRCPKFGGFCDLCSKHGCCALKQPLWEQPLHIIPKPVPRHVPLMTDGMLQMMHGYLFEVGNKYEPIEDEV